MIYNGNMETTNLINKKSSILLFSLSLVTFIGFGYLEHLSDNYFSVSDQSVQFYPIYLLNSLIASLVYFLGPWIIFPGFMGVVAFSLKKVRDQIIAQSFFQIMLWSFCLICIFFIMPVFVSKGITIYLDQISNHILFSISVFSFCFICWSLDKNDFLKNFIQTKLYHSISSLFQDTSEKFKALSKSILNRKEHNITTRIDASVQENLSSRSIYNENKHSEVENSSSKISMESLKKTKVPEVVQAPKKKIDFSLNKLKSNKKRVSKQLFQDYFDNVNLKPGRRSALNSSNPNHDYFEKIIMRIEEKLLEFKIEGKIINILKGPVVDTFELELGSGVKVSKVTRSAITLAVVQ